MTDDRLPDDRLWTQADVARYLRVSVKTVQRLAPPRVPGLRFPRYQPAVVRAWFTDAPDAIPAVRRRRFA